MANKEFKIYTKGGDFGKTSLTGGTRVDKFDLQVEAYGNIDETKSYLGLVYDYADDMISKKNLLMIIEKLFIAESLVSADSIESMAKLPQLKEEDIEFLEKDIDRMNKILSPLKAFILPGGHPMISHCHIARTICRRAERAYLRYDTKKELPPFVGKYLNRLSDYLFILARYSAKKLDVDELLWLPKKSK
ncbi:MAG: cob(I)yrinic acid a,c-diamide adenosyltransferase [Bacteroidetes bacterium]|nr:MAG: cob(I)yrinic acid a,c-diamide adenosyltransferase [Bacteroidota bacterium]